MGIGLCIFTWRYQVLGLSANAKSQFFTGIFIGNKSSEGLMDFLAFLVQNLWAENAK